MALPRVADFDLNVRLEEDEDGNLPFDLNEPVLEGDRAPWRGSKLQAAASSGERRGRSPVRGEPPSERAESGVRQPRAASGEGESCKRQPQASKRREAEGNRRARQQC